jgi:DNA-directed RNA polymerase specialized sigma24 family protein/CheY-like chemotaxis protein
MNDTTATVDISQKIAAELPYLRRYARAMTGSQSSGDAYAAATLEAILEDRSIFAGDMRPKVALFRVFHDIWTSTGARVDIPASALEQRAQKHLSRLTEGTREALLLHSLEQLSAEDISKIMRVEPAEVSELLSIAHQEMSRSLSGRVLVIEDEAIIAMDLESIVADMGHRVVGIARTRDAAVKMAKSDKPDLVLADIQLADNSSGIDAVNEILATYSDMPVIFITAFPERLLTGERPEPAFLISKPYSEDQVRSAVSQAMFFASTETLNT